MPVHKNSLQLIVKDSPLNPHGACPNVSLLGSAVSQQTAQLGLAGDSSSKDRINADSRWSIIFRNSPSFTALTLGKVLY